MACDFWAKGLNCNSLDGAGLSPLVFGCSPISTRVVETFWRRLCGLAAGRVPLSRGDLLITAAALALLVGIIIVVVWGGSYLVQPLPYRLSRLLERCARRGFGQLPGKF